MCRDTHIYIYNFSPFCFAWLVFITNLWCRKMTCLNTALHVIFFFVPPCPPQILFIQVTYCISKQFWYGDENVSMLFSMKKQHVETMHFDNADLTRYDANHFSDQWTMDHVHESQKSCGKNNGQPYFQTPILVATTISCIVKSFTLRQESLSRWIDNLGGACMPPTWGGPAAVKITGEDW